MNITISRCRILGNLYHSRSTNLVLGQYSNGNNAIISKNWFSSGGFITADNPSYIGIAGLNFNVSNNILNGTIAYLNNSVISNNTFFSTSTNGNILNCNGSTISNNIFDSRSVGTGTFQFASNGTGNTISNNLCTSIAGNPTGNGNIAFADATTLFAISSPYTTGPILEANFQLAAGSPAIGIGTGGTNAGAFGGVNPYLLSGLPPNPIITNFTTTGVGNSTTPLSVSVTVRGNN